MWKVLGIAAIVVKLLVIATITYKVFGETGPWTATSILFCLLWIEVISYYSYKSRTNIKSLWGAVESLATLHGKLISALSTNANKVTEMPTTKPAGKNSVN